MQVQKKSQKRKSTQLFDKQDEPCQNTRKMTRETLTEELHRRAEQDYAVFAAKLIPGETRLLGVRLPILRQLARRCAAEDWRGLLNEQPPQTASFEELLLRAMLPAYASDASLGERLRYLAQEQPRLRNWSLCDSCVATCHFVRQHKAEVSLWLEGFLNSADEFTARFGVVMLNHYYAADESWVTWVIEKLAQVQASGYYADMAVAWCACTILTTHLDAHRGIGEALLQPGYLPARTQKLLHRKLHESHKKWGHDKIY